MYGMQLSKTEECLLLHYHLKNGAETHVISELKKHYQKIPVEEAISRLYAAVFSNTTTTEWNEFQAVQKVLHGLFLRRRYDVWAFFATEETVKGFFPDGAPEIVNIDHDLLPPQTLQLGLYLLYLTTQVTKADDEDESEFQQRKDWHDWLNGYLNQESIQRPFFTIIELLDELEHWREIVNNHIRNFFDGLDI
jgi:hypothetical protein